VNAFIKYIIEILMDYLKRIWYIVKMKELKKELTLKEKESEDAVKRAGEAVDDFESSYRLFKQQDKDGDRKPE